MQHVASESERFGTMSAMNKTSPNPAKIGKALKLPPAPAAVTRAKQAAEAARAAVQVARDRRERLASVARLGRGIPEETQAKISEADAEIAELQAAADEAGRKHAAAVTTYAAEARNKLAPAIDEYEMAVAAALADLAALLKQGTALQHEARGIGFTIPARSLDASAGLLRLMGASLKLTAAWK